MDEIELLRLRMEEAATLLDFDEARRLRDRIALLRAGAGSDAAAGADTSGLMRQQPGAMGIGSNKPRPERPDGWTPPPRPDPMTTGGKRRGK